MRNTAIALTCVLVVVAARSAHAQTPSQGKFLRELAQASHVADRCDLVEVNWPVVELAFARLRLKASDLGANGQYDTMFRAEITRTREGLATANDGQVCVLGMSMFADNRKGLKLLRRK